MELCHNVKVHQVSEVSKERVRMGEVEHAPTQADFEHDIMLILQRKEALERRISFLFTNAFKHHKDSLFSLVGVCKDDREAQQSIEADRVIVLHGGLMLDYIFEFALRSFGYHWEHFHSQVDDNAKSILYPFAGRINELPKEVLDVEMELLHIVSEAKRFHLMSSVVSTFETCMISIRSKMMQDYGVMNLQ
jgi:hypothetical protein